MPIPKFIQLHLALQYSVVNLNRDSDGIPKAISYGGVLRNRMSSQAIKRQLRFAEGPYSLMDLADPENPDPGVRSKEIVTQLIIRPLRATEIASEEVLLAVEQVFQTEIYGRQGNRPENRQLQFLGHHEIRYFANNARAAATEHPDDPEAATAAAQAFFETHKANIRILLELSRIPGGMTNAMFGRMVTSDYASGGLAAIEVAHAITPHAAIPEIDYLVALDDLTKQGGHISEDELNSGIYYLYAVVNLPQLIANIESCHPTEWLEADRSLAADAVHNLTLLMATNISGAKRGSTAGYTYASFILAEAGERQPRSLAGAFQIPTQPTTHSVADAMFRKLDSIERNFGAHEARRFMPDLDMTGNGITECSALELAEWLRSSIIAGEAQ